MEEELAQISLKAQFILDIINKKIKVNNVPKAEIVAQLEAAKYPKMLVDKLVQPSSEEYTDDRASYNFLVQMPIYNLTKEKVEELLAEKDRIAAALLAFKAKTAKDLWRDDLANLEEEYKKFMADYYDYMSMEPPTKTVKKTLSLSRK
jgi:DNA topoisomerase-2